MAPTEERRRVELFTWGLALTMGLVYLSVFLDSSIPSIQSFLAARRTLYFSIAYPLMAMTPLATSYSVLVDRVFDIRFIVRKAIQYALARSTVLTLTALPFAFLIVLLYQQRSQTLASLLEGTRSLALVAAVIVGLAAYRIRGRVLTAIDRQFFRDHYDTNRILANLVERTRMTSSSQELSDLLRRELDRAIHPEKVIIVLLDTGKAVLRSLDDMCRPLDLTSELVAMVEAQQSPVSVDPHFGRSLFGELPDEDRSWVTAHGVTLLAPLIGSTGALVGIIALGPKKSELPYSAEDWTLMSAIAASSALVAENRINAETPAVRHPMDPSLPDPAPAGNGRFCPSCNRIETAGTKTCPECGRAMDDASVPCVLAGKFRIEVRVGTGGMGVVYRAVDLTLRRKVAVKTLPRISAVASARLRQEARAIAAVQHPNLALIHGAESWHGVPFLIFEYFGAGTLADRLSDGPLSATETVEIGIALANALERIHRIGMLHRDIKPSNIGLTDEGTPKLMDFGLARLYSWMDWEDRVPEIQSDPGRTMTAPAFETESRGTGLAGTPIYMSPEAVQGRPPSPASDLWALAIVLYECLAGKHPLSECAPEQLLTAIREGRFPGIEALVPACPPNLGAFFAAALSPHILDRPQSARELAGHLRRLRFP
jgi:hypothetical protein